MKKTLESASNATMEDKQEGKEESFAEYKEREEEEDVEQEDFRYANSQEHMKTGAIQWKKEEDGLERVVEDDDLSFLGEEIEEEESKKQKEKESEDQSVVSEEYEWDDTQLDMGANAIEETKDRSEEKVESGETKAEAAKKFKLGARKDDKDTKLEKKRKEDKEKVTKMNPYL